MEIGELVLIVGMGVAIFGGFAVFFKAINRDDIGMLVKYLNSDRKSVV